MLSFYRLKRLFLGEPLTSQMSSHQRIPKWKALAILSSDALSSVAYATEEILIPLAGFGLMAVAWSVPIALCIVILLTVLTLSYRQTIEAYPNGGGAYTVAKENLGLHSGLIAAASLLIDYVLTVSVSVASGVENLGSAFPWILQHREILCAFIIGGITLLNLRGVRESAAIFSIPTYLFMGSLGVLIVSGLYQSWMAEFPSLSILSHPQTYVDSLPTIPLYLGLRAFASGCSALTGVEAISNGIPIFRVPSQRNAKTTLMLMSAILGGLFIGITVLTHFYRIVPIEGETTISMLAHAVLGGGFWYYAVTATTAMILFLAANTSYADFPRLASLLARDRFVPRQLAAIGDRLVFSNGIIGLGVIAFLMVVVFKAETHRLIPLYAVGVFLSFTLSQGGMIIHHWKKRERYWRRSLSFNLIGALTTLGVLAVITATKFLAGAWMVMLFIPILVLIFFQIHEHYLAVGRELTLLHEEPHGKLEPVKHAVIVPVSGMHRGVLEALRYALTISDDVRACYVEVDAVTTERMQSEWKRWAPEIPFVVLLSPYRSVITPILEYLDDVENTSCRRLITVIIPEFVTSKWRYQILHNQTGLLIRAALLFRTRRVVTSVRYHLKNA